MYVRSCQRYCQVQYMYSISTCVTNSPCYIGVYAHSIFLHSASARIPVLDVVHLARTWVECLLIAVDAVEKQGVRLKVEISRQLTIDTYCNVVFCNVYAAQRLKECGPARHTYILYVCVYVRGMYGDCYGFRLTCCNPIV